MKDKTVYLICLSVFPFMVCTGIIYSILPLEGNRRVRSQHLTFVLKVET